MSWSIRDLDNDARKRAVEAADRAGVTVDEWLNSVIRAETGHARDAVPPEARRDRVRPEYERAERLRDSTAASPRSVAPRATDKDNISEIASALDRLLAEAGAQAEPAGARKQAMRPLSPADRRRADARDSSSFAPQPTEEARKRTPDVSPQERTQRVERVLEALGKLDERVRSLSDRPQSTSAPAPRHKEERPVQDRRLSERRASADPRPADLFRQLSPSPTRQEATAETPRRRASDFRSQDADNPPAGRRGYDRDPQREERMRDYDRRSTATERNDGREPPVLSGGHGFSGGRDAPGGVDFERHFRDLANRIDSLREPQDGAFTDLRDEISDLRRSIERRERNGLSDRDLGDISRLIASVERMQREAPDPDLSADVRAEIADLRDLVLSQNIDGAMKTLESGYAHMVERLDDMRRQVQDPHLFRALDQRLDDIEQGLADIPRASSFAAYDDRLEDLSHRLETLVSRGVLDGLEGLGNLDHLEHEMRELRAAIGDLDVRDLVRNVDGQLRDMAARIEDMMAGAPGDLHDRLLAFEDRLPEPGLFNKLNSRMERISSMLAEDKSSSGGVSQRMDDRLGEILGRLDRIERQGGNTGEFEKALGLLERRIESITGKLDALDGVSIDTGPLNDAIARIDAAADRVGTDKLDELHAQVSAIAGSLETGGLTSPSSSDIAALREDVSALRQEFTQNGSLAATIEPQIQQLARSLVIDAGGAADDSKLQRIEQQIAVIAGQLDATEDRLAGLGHIEAALERIDAAVAGGGSLAQPGEAQAAPGSNEAIDALRGDLSRLFEAAQDNRRESDDSLAKVQSVLNDIVARLAHLEQDAEREGNLGYAEVAMGGGGRRVLMSRSSLPPRNPPLHGDREFDTASHESAENPAGPDLSTVEDLPLEPGSGKPDLAAILRAQASESSGKMGSGDRKADFIAAARRAAQMAAAEVSGGADETDEGDGERRDRGAWLRDRLKRSRSDDTVAPVSPEEASERAPMTKAEKVKAKAAKARMAADLGQETPAKSRSRLRRPLIFAAAAVILTIGALQVSRMLAPAGDAPAPQPAPIAEGTDQPAKRPVTKSSGATEETNVAASSSAGEGNVIPPAPSSTPDKSVAFEPPAAEPGRFGAPDAVQPFGRFQPEAGASAGAAAPQGDSAPSTSTPDAAVGPLALRLAATDGDPRAQFEIALRYTEGKGVTADLAKAAKWYRRAAEGGLAPAQYRLGSFYEKGRGLPRDLSQARDWYQRAANQGNIKAMHNLAVLLADGGLGKPDFTGAARWFSKAAEYGVRDSQFNLGVLYARGLGVPKDLAASYKWFAIAARLGDSDAASKRDEIANTLPEDRLAQARKAVSGWQQKTVRPEANTVDIEDAWKAKPDNAADSSRNLVKQTQALLGRLGYDAGPADGVLGPRTIDAVRAFQFQAGLPVDGAINPQLVRKLAGRSI